MRKRFTYLGMFDFIYLHPWAILCRLTAWNRGYISPDWSVFTVDLSTSHHFK